MDLDHIGIGDKKNHHDGAPCMSEMDAMPSNCVLFLGVDAGRTGGRAPFGEVHGGGPIDTPLSSGVNYGDLSGSENPSEDEHSL
ncbi:hypothetical protein R1flu_024071 [Riccia fluitans]|uniref:Uncharacterized protein n=1 Tax=Riccia fluitans TaxID=41844 RepID=A0ABD1XTU3_9MARC